MMTVPIAHLTLVAENAGEIANHFVGSTYEERAWILRGVDTQLRYPVTDIAGHVHDLIRQQCEEVREEVQC